MVTGLLSSSHLLSHHAWMSVGSTALGFFLTQSKKDWTIFCLFFSTSARRRYSTPVEANAHR